MNRLITAILIICTSFSSWANDQEKQIRNYISEINSTQDKIASILLMQTYSRFMADSSSIDLNTNLNFIHSPTEAKGLSALSESFFDIVYSDASDENKINDITKIFILIKRSQRSWLSQGSNIKKAHEDFFQSFSSISQICNTDSFNRSMAVLENFSPTGIDSGKLRQAWDLKVGGSVTVNQNGESHFGPYASLTRSGDGSNSAEARHAAATTAGALALYAPPPYNIIGAIALPILIETVWGIIDMNKNMHEMNKIAKANRDLYSTMRFEINVKKSYLDKCQKFQAAYQDIREPILNALKTNDSGQLEMMIKGLSESKFHQEDLDELIKDFKNFSEMKLLNDAINLIASESSYQQQHQIVWQKTEDFIQNIDKALTQIISQKNAAITQGNPVLFASILNRIDNFYSFKKFFTKELLNFFDSPQEQRKHSFTIMKQMLENYPLLNPDLGQEERETINTYAEVLIKIEGTL